MSARETQTKRRATNGANGKKARRALALYLAVMMCCASAVTLIGCLTASAGSSDGTSEKLTDFTVLSGSFVLSDDGTSIVGNSNGRGDTFAVFDQKIPADALFVFEATVSAEETNPDYNASLVFGLLDTGKPSHRFYDFGIMAASDRFIRFDQTDGVPLSGVDVGSIEHRKSYRVRIERTGADTFVYSIDGQVIFEKIHADYQGGYFGMMTNGNAKYEDVTLTRTDGPAVAEEPKFTSDLSGLTPINGTWKETPAGLQGITRGGDTWAFFTEKCLDADTDFIYEADLTLKTGNHAAGILFGMENPQSDKGYPDALICHMAARGDGNMMAFAHRDGTAAWIEAAGLSDADKKAELYHLRVEKTGTKAACYINGTLYKTVELPGYTGGYLGLMVAGGTTCLFDNVHFETVSAPEIGTVTVTGEGVSQTFTQESSPYITVDFAVSEVEITADFGAGLTGSVAGKAATAGVPVKVKLGLLDNAVEVRVKNPETGLSSAMTLHINREPDSAGLYKEAMRPVFHFTPYAGQMNDPNGLVYLSETGEYHLFFQCNRAFDNGVPGLVGTTSWGHAVSTDMLTWTELPLAITPDQWGMAWSGSAVVDRNNTSGLFDDSTPPESRLVCFYAAVGSGYEYGYCKECMAYSTDGGRTFIRYSGNPVVKNPQDTYGSGLRDPKVFWYENEKLAGGGIWVMVTVGNLSIFTSHNLIDWTFCGRPVDPDGNLFDSECPDLYPLPVDGNPENVKWVYTGGGIFYMLGHMEVTAEDKVMYVPETGKLYAVNGIADQGPGNLSPETYATQTVHNEKLGRTVSISWLRDPTLFVYDKIWNSAQSLPMEHSLRTVGETVKLFSYPVEEVNTLRGEPIFSAENLEINEKTENPLASVRSDCCDIVADIELGTATQVTLEVRMGRKNGLIIRYDREADKLYVDKTKLGDSSYTGVYEPELTLLDGNRITLRVLVDKTCFDVYGNGGEAAVAGLVLTDTVNDKMSLTANGTATLRSLTVYPMSRDNIGKTTDPVTEPDTDADPATDTGLEPGGTTDPDDTVPADADTAKTDAPDVASDKTDAGKDGCASVTPFPALVLAAVAAALALALSVKSRRRTGWR